MTMNYRNEINHIVEIRKSSYTHISDSIWEFAESRFQEYRSSNIQQEYLRSQGFAIQSNLSGEETAFIAEWGSGKPIIAFVLIVLKSIEETDRFFAHVSEDPDFLECHAITGEYDCMLKVCVASVEELDRKLAVLKTHNGVMKSYTMLSLTTHKYSPTVLPSTP